MDQELPPADRIPVKPQTTEIQVSASGEGPKMVDLLVDKPYVSFFLSEFWTSIVTVSVYGFCRVGSWLTEQIDTLLPIADTGPGNFLSEVLSWGGAVGASITFAVISVFQIVVLVKRLRRRFDDDR